MAFENGWKAVIVPFADSRCEGDVSDMDDGGAVTAAAAAAAAAARLALLRFPGTFPILEIEKIHSEPRLAQR